MANEAKFDQVTKARARLIHWQPFFGVLALQLNMQETHDVPTLGVDGKTIFYNPDFVGTLTFDLLCSAMCHEVMHCVFDHVTRRGSRDAKRWNYAGDYAINLLLKEMGLTLGSTWLYDEQYKDMTADEIYNKLPEKLGPSDFVCEIGHGGGGVGASEAAEIQVMWKVATVQAAMLAKQQGKLPGALERFIESITSPQVDWKEQLRHLLSTFAPIDYSWAKPNRRHIAAGTYLPSIDGQNAGKIVCVIDTSGSITQDMLNTFGSEIIGIRDSVHPSTHIVIYCDAAVAHVDEFEMYDEMHFALHGGGGTDFRPPFKWLEERDTAPVCLVYLTDGYGPFGDQPAYPVIWCMTTDVTPPWGATIRVKA